MSRYRIDWPRTIGAALATVSAAVVLSRLGAIGTLTGAAIGSVVLSIGTSIYAQGISRTHKTVLAARRGAPVSAEAQVDDEPLPVGARPVQWKHVWVMAVGLFAFALVLITSFELATGRPLSSYVGGGGHGTSITNLTGGGRSTPKPAPTPTPSPSAPPTPTPSSTPTASSIPIATPTTPTPSPVASPSTQPSPSTAVLP